MDGQSKDSEASQRFLEFLKIEYDYDKHLVTLNLAAIAFFGAALGGFFKTFDHPLRTWVILATFGSFITSALLAADAAWQVERLILLTTKAPEPPEKALDLLPRTGRAAMWVFTIGLLLFIDYAALSATISLLSVLLADVLVIGVVLIWHTWRRPRWWRW